MLNLAEDCIMRLKIKICLEMSYYKTNEDDFILPFRDLKSNCIIKRVPLFKSCLLPKSYLQETQTLQLN